jgi:hypothetical protein
VKPRNLRAKAERRNQKNNIIRCEEVTSRRYSNELAGLVMSLFGKPQAVLKSKCISHDA